MIFFLHLNSSAIIPTYFKMHTSLQLSDIRPAIPLLILKHQKITNWENQIKCNIGSKMFIKGNNPQMIGVSTYTLCLYKVYIQIKPLSPHDALKHHFWKQA